MFRSQISPILDHKITNNRRSPIYKERRLSASFSIYSTLAMSSPAMDLSDPSLEWTNVTIYSLKSSSKLEAKKANDKTQQLYENCVHF